MSEYYTARKAIDVIGDIYHAQLLQYAASGKIRTYTPKGKKHRVYLKEDVERVAQERRVERESIQIIDKDDNNDRRITHRARGSPLLASG